MMGCSLILISCFAILLFAEFVLALFALPCFVFADFGFKIVVFCSCCLLASLILAMFAFDTILVNRVLAIFG